MTKKILAILTLGILLAAPMNGMAATYKGETGIPNQAICERLTALIPTFAEEACEVNATSANVVIFGKGPRAKAGDAAVIRYKGQDGKRGKALAKIVAVVPLDREKGLELKADDGDSAILLWIDEEKQTVTLLQVEKGFDIPRGTKVKLKIKRARAAVEGC